MPSTDARPANGSLFSPGSLPRRHQPHAQRHHPPCRPAEDARLRLPHPPRPRCPHRPALYGAEGAVVAVGGWKAGGPENVQEAGGVGAGIGFGVEVIRIHSAST